MGTLLQLSTGTTLPLAARHVVGRSRSCQLQLAHASVSALHAELAWNGELWHLRDLGSRNGTFAAGQRIAPGQQIVLAPGMDLGFGVAERAYRFADGAPPRLIAFASDGARVADDDDVLVLPSRDECEAMIFRNADDRWVIETAGGQRPLADEDRVVLAGRAFEIQLPGSGRATRDAVELAEARAEHGVFELLVSRDGEHVDLRFRDGDRVEPIESRAHAFLLLALARSRLEDAATGLPESEHGWTHREDLMKALAIEDPQLLNVWVYRARQQLAQIKLCGAARVIERREGAGQLRLGFQRVRVIYA